MNNIETNQKADASQTKRVTRIYLGLGGGSRTIFRCEHEPTRETHGERFMAVIGPFRTMAGAEVMKLYGENNPHLQQVSDAERMAKRLMAQPEV